MQPKNVRPGRTTSESPLLNLGRIRGPQIPSVRTELWRVTEGGPEPSLTVVEVRNPRPQPRWDRLQVQHRRFFAALLGLVPLQITIEPRVAGLGRLGFVSNPPGVGELLNLPLTSHPVMKSCGIPPNRVRTIAFCYSKRAAFPTFFHPRKDKRLVRIILRRHVETNVSLALVIWVVVPLDLKPRGPG